MRTNPTQQLMLQMKQPCQNTSCAFDQASHQEKISHYWILTCSIYWVSRRGGGGGRANEKSFNTFFTISFFHVYNQCGGNLEIIIQDPPAVTEATPPSAGVVFTVHNGQNRPVSIHDLKASSLGSSMYFHRLRTTLYFSVVVVSPNTLRGATLIRATVLFSRFSDSTRSKVSPTFT